MQDNRNNKKNSPNLRFPEFDGEWKEITFGKCAESLDYGMNAPATDYDGKNKYIRITDIDESSSRYISDNPVSPLGELLDKYVVNENDILLARTGASTGKAYLYNKEDGKLYFAGFLIRMKILNEHNSVFVFLQTQTHQYNKWVKLMSMRSGQPGINSQEYSSFKFWLTNKIEQDKIATFLTLIDERILKQSKIIEGLKLLIKSLNNDIFETIKKDSKQVLFSELYTIAKEGGTPNTNNLQYYENGKIPFIKIDDLKTKYLNDNQWFITEDGLNNSSAWIVPENSIIYSNGATIGSISINKYPIATKQGILGIVVKDNISLEYLFYFMKSKYFREEICKITTHGTMKTAYIKDIDKIKCYLPEYTIQIKIAKILNALTLKIELEELFLKKLENQKNFLLQNLFI